MYFIFTIKKIHHNLQHFSNIEWTGPILGENSLQKRNETRSWDVYFHYIEEIHTLVSVFIAVFLSIQELCLLSNPSHLTNNLISSQQVFLQNQHQNVEFSATLWYRKHLRFFACFENVKNLLDLIGLFTFEKCSRCLLMRTFIFI